MNAQIKEIIYSNDFEKKRALFAFNIDDNSNLILKKFNYWAKFFFPEYFTDRDAEFHKKIDLYNLQIYKNEISSFTDIVFRGGGKSARTKLFLAFCIANDLGHFKKYIKVLAYDLTNSKQVTTDIYNMFVQPRVRTLYPEIFEKTNLKREETMSGFTTASGVKLLAGTVGTDQRGALQDEARPDIIYFDDFENRKTLRSAVITRAIWDNMEEARTSLSQNGGCIYCCNYISEAGNVHRLVQKKSEKNVVMIVPIVDKQDVLAWDRYTHNDIELMKNTDDDYAGERLCSPSASSEIMFDREKLEKQEIKKPIRETAGFKIFHEYNPSHKYGSGHDVAGGVGLDSSASVHIDFSTVPARVVGTFVSNLIKPEVFGDEIFREQQIFPGIAGIENNFGTEAILKAKLLGTNLYSQNRRENVKIEVVDRMEYGWQTNSLTKSQMINGLVEACDNGLLELSDEALIAECKSYTRNDLLDKSTDVRLTTRHFDIFCAVAIAWQMKDSVFTVSISKKKKRKIKTSIYD